MVAGAIWTQSLKLVSPIAAWHSLAAFSLNGFLPAPYIVPSNLYPKKQFILPYIMSEEEVIQLFAAPLTLKEHCVVGLLYGYGLRIR